MQKNFLSFFLLGAMLLSAVSCGGAAPTDTTDPVDSGSDTPPAETEPAIPFPDIEKCDYNGEAFNIYSPSWSLYNGYYHADEETGDTMDDALYKRNRLVEEHLGIDVTYTCEGGIGDIPINMQSWVMSGDVPYQLVLTHCLNGVGTMASENLLYDWNQLPAIDMEQEYWSKSINDALAISGKLYFAVSDYMYKIPYCMYFNKLLIDAYNLENPYELVREGKWTLEKMLEMASVALKDLNGDNTYDIGDQYGLVGEGDSMLISFLYSSGLTLTSRAEDGSFDITLKSEKTVKLCEILDQAINKENYCHFWKYGTPADQRPSFQDGQALFTMAATDGLRNTRSWEIDFGILPYPKWDESQENYLNNDWGGFMCIPTNVSNPEMVGKACEMFAYYSGETTVPAYYEIMMSEKFARDEDAKEMLELILSNECIVYDAGYNYQGTSTEMRALFYMIPRMIFQNGENNFASWYESYAPIAERELDLFLETIANRADE